MAVAGPSVPDYLSLGLLIISYGQAKLGKTVDAVYTFPSGEVIGDPQGSLSAFTVLGIAPRLTQSFTLESTLERVRQLGNTAKAQRPSAVIVDDLSIQARNTESILKGAKGQADLFKVFNTIGMYVNTIFRIAQDSGMHVFFTAHENPRDPANDRPTGCPQLPSYKIGRDIAGVASILVRVVEDPMRRPAVAYVTSPDPMAAGWMAGDRLNVIRGRAPVNMAEALRARGLVIPRAVGMDHLEEFVEWGHQYIAGGAPVMDVAQYVNQQMLAKNEPEHHRRWVIRDMKDRAELRRPRDDISWLLGG